MRNRAQSEPSSGVRSAKPVDISRLCSVHAARLPAVYARMRFSTPCNHRHGQGVEVILMVCTGPYPLS